MKAIKDKKGTHNRGYGGPIYEYYTKEERKERRKMFKSVRHKLKMQIPLTAEEEEYRIAHRINSDSKMTYDGGHAL